jgi:GNAT superfamily N-acetyltransferase
MVAAFQPPGDKKVSTANSHETAISIRRATPEDVPAMLALVKALAEYQGQAGKMRATAEDYLRDGFGPAPLFDCQLAFLGGRLVGLAIHHITYSTWIGRRGEFVQDLYVDESARGAGVGAALLREVARIGRGRGANHIRLNVTRDNPSRAFYHRVGFTEVADFLVYELSGGGFDRL